MRCETGRKTGAARCHLLWDAQMRSPRGAFSCRRCLWRGAKSEVEGDSRVATRGMLAAPRPFLHLIIIIPSSLSNAHVECMGMHV